MVRAESVERRVMRFGPGCTEKSREKLVIFSCNFNANFNYAH